MVLTFIKKSLALLLIVLVLISSDYILIYGMHTRMREALINSVDSAIITNMDNSGLGYANMDTDYLPAEIAFYNTLKAELGLDSDMKSDTFFKNGVTVESLHMDWRDDYPIVRAKISTTVNTIIVHKFIPESNKVIIDNFDHLYWQWSQKGARKK